jgi:hypothetical protein
LKIKKENKKAYTIFFVTIGRVLGFFFVFSVSDSELEELFSCTSSDSEFKVTVFFPFDGSPSESLFETALILKYKSYR